MRAEHQWEYCILQRSSTVPQPARVSVSARVAFCGEDAESVEVNAHQWDRALGQLGRYGWKLVSATATQIIIGTSAGTTDTLYFKRQVQVGRKASEPALVVLCGATGATRRSRGAVAARRAGVLSARPIAPDDCRPPFACNQLTSR